MPSGVVLAAQFVTKLRAKKEADQVQAARELSSFINGEIKENSPEVIREFLSKFDQYILDMATDNDVSARKAAIFAIVCMVSLENSRLPAIDRNTRYGNQLRNMLPSNDQNVTELAARAIAHYAVVAASHNAEYVDFVLKQALEWLQSTDRNESRHYASVCLLKEFALATPTYFFQHVQPFFEVIFNAIRSNKAYIREQSVAALRAALVVTSQREINENVKTQFYKLCYDEAQKCFDENKDDRVHAGLLAFNELMRNANSDGEKARQEAEDLVTTDNSITSSSVVSPGDLQRRNARRASAHTRVSAEKQDDDVISSLVGPSQHPAFESRTCRHLVTENYDAICRNVLHSRTALNTPMNRAVLLQLVPRLAAFDGVKFLRSYLNDAVTLIFECIKRDKTMVENRSSVFLAIGLVCSAVTTAITESDDTDLGDGMRPYLPRIFEFLRSQLPSKDAPKRKNQLPPDAAVFTCFTCLVRSLGSSVHHYMREMLEPLFAVGLSVPLNIALRETAKHIPALKIEIHDGLLKKLSWILLGRPMPSKLFMAQVVPPSPTQQSLTTADPATLSLALRTLGSFDFARHSMQVFLHYIAEGFLQSEHYEVRFEAVRTTCRLLIPTVELLARAKNKQQHLPTLKMAHGIIYQILTTGIADADSRIRLCVFESLSEIFDPHLAQPECLQVIFMGLQDEQWEIREAVLLLLGRLGEINPAYVMPTLRKVLVHILGELNFSGIGRNKEQGARFLAQLTASSPKFMKPYIQPVLKTLIQKLQEKDQHTDVIVGVLTAIGEIAQIDGGEMLKHLDVVMPLLIEFLQDASSIAKRQVSLWSLGQIIASTSGVVDPYQRHPELLEILLGFLKTEQTHSIRHETIRVLGILGALDPYKQKVYTKRVDTAANSTGLALSMSEKRSTNDPRQEIIQWFHWERCTLEEFYPAIAVASLMHIVQDSALAQHHTNVVQAIMYIFNSLGTKCIPFLDQVVPSFINVIHNADPTFREFLFQHLGTLIAIVKHHIKPYLLDVLKLIKVFWTPDTPMRHTIIMLVEQLAIALGTDFKPYVAQLLPSILKVFMYDNSEAKSVTAKLLEALRVCGQTIEEYLHLIIPPVVKIIDSSDTPLRVRVLAVETLEQIAFCVKLNSYAARILHPLVRLIRSSANNTALDNNNSAALLEPAVGLIRILVVQMQQDFLIFKPLVDSALSSCARSAVQISEGRAAYERLVHKLLMEGTVHEADDKVSAEKKQKSKRLYSMEITALGSSEPTAAPSGKTRCNLDNLQRAWDVSKCVSKDDWAEWLRKLSLELLKDSPYHALRSCHMTSQAYFPLARDLFNASFIACWTELPETYQNDLISCLEKALSLSDTSEITQTILNLAEFMDHSEKGPLPINPELLGERALKTRAYAKALRYKEFEFLRKDVTPAVLEALISINNKLGVQEESAGVVEYARKHQISAVIKERWLEKLHDWDKALESYEAKLNENPAELEATLGRMRCLEQLGQWNRLHAVAKDRWDAPAADRDVVRTQIARMAAAAAWGLGLWDHMESYTCYLNRNSFDGAFYRAVEAVHSDQFPYAQQLVDKARDIVDTELSALVGESYNRAYGAMVQVQMLTELEEAILYKLMPEKRATIKQTWWNRLHNCQESVEDWYKILKDRSLVMSSQDMRKTWLKFASLCRKSGKLEMAQRTLISLGIDTAQVSFESPDLSFQFAKQLWAEEKRDSAIKYLRALVDGITKQSPTNQQPGLAGLAGAAMTNAPPLITLTEVGILSPHEVLHLKARCYLKLGQWQEYFPSGPPEVQLTQVMQCFRAATECDRSWYKAWHALAQSNFDAVLFYKDQMQAAGTTDMYRVQFAPVNTGAAPGEAEMPMPAPVNLRALAESMVSMHAVSSVQCFFQAIMYSKGQGLQDTLRLLTLWFEYGQHNEVHDALLDGNKRVPVETWLQVIPQLMARIDTPRQMINRLIIDLLMNVGRAHPQALVYPLSVASKSTQPIRQQAANRILKHMREHSPNLVAQAKLVSEELIRVAILWHELWHEGLEEASRQYFAERNVQGMFATLEPLHAIIEAGPTTLKETSFNQAYYRDLKDAREWCLKFQQTQNVKDLTQAWDLYYHVFKRISKQLPQLTSLELQYVSPKLLMCKDLELVVPGTYDPAKPLIRIASVLPSVQVITSKQRPRKITIKGSDGQDYVFLLKGHEDPRQDERVMQLFGLVNQLLLQKPETCRRNLTIQRYSVIPLSQNSGLIGWVPNCDTLHALLRDYREKKKILLNIEHKLMQRMAPDYDHLTLMQKVEVFEHALEHTNGDDLAKILWLKSPSSEVWFDRRTNYSRSLAVMSMVGYILGLGDRHPSNLMLDRMSGKIVHIDFGDCFEVAMTREKYPEKIPFRLTRMLVNAMEVTGIEGNYRTTCERVLTVLRENKDSLMAVLEAFVYDPLINWRLIENTGAGAKMGQAGDSSIVDKDADVGMLREDTAVGVPPGYALQLPAMEAIPGQPHHLLQPPPNAQAAQGPAGQQPTEAVSKKAIQILQRIRDKLTGRDFLVVSPCSTTVQVQFLIDQATSHENLCQCYIGWCPFW